ncbi:hypothetical protein GY45DRAFT_1323106 [Cubamyces sp. BRFM 1775]|nr:hypothetical protein GY45DRAFT_1323106 [Cubamyces sp. BRFM 1775]
MRSVSRLWSRLRRSSRRQHHSIGRLPDELLFACLSLLDAPGVVKNRQVCRRWRDLIDCDAYLQLKIELWASDLLDGPPSNVGIEERLKLLREYKERRKDAQFYADLDYRLGPEDVDGQMQGSVDGSISYILPAGTSPRLVICSPPSSLRCLDKRIWALTLDNIEGTIRMIATDVAQDLLMVAETPPDRQWDVRFHFLSIDNGGQPHPSAVSPITRQLPPDMQGEMRYHFNVFSMRICGDHVAWNLRRPSNLDDPRCYEFEIWNWKTGRLVWARIFNKFVMATFLDPCHILLVGKAFQSRRIMHIHRITTSNGSAILNLALSVDPTHICSLQLPPLLGSCTSQIFCDRLTCTAHTPTTGSIFAPDPASALVTLQFLVENVRFILVIPLWALRRKINEVLARPAYRRWRLLFWSDWGPQCSVVLPLAYRRSYTQRFLLQDLEAFGSRLGLLPEFDEGNPDSGRIILLDFSCTHGRARYASPVASELLNSALVHRDTWSRFFSKETMRSTLPYCVTVGPNVTLPRWNDERTAVASRLIMQPDGFTLAYEQLGQPWQDVPHLRFDTYYI